MAETSNAYAAALFSLALETHSEEEIMSSLAELRALVDENPQYLAVLSSPAIPRGERLNVLRDALGARFSDTVMGFLGTLIQNGQIRRLKGCIKDYEELFQASRGLSVAQVISAVPLTAEETKSLRQKLEARTGHTVRLECRTDASLLGGLVVTVDGKVMDGTIKHRLSEIKDVMNQ